MRGKARDEVLDWLARFLFRLGVRPNHLTLAQTPVYVVMIYTGFTGRIWIFGFLQLLVIFLDGLDGTVARRMGIQSRGGAYLDAAFDLFGIVLVMAVAIHAFPAYASPLGLLLVTNLLLYYQNYRLDEKAVSYVRGPVVLGLLAERHWPGVMWIAIWVPLAVTVLIVVVRMVRQPRPVPPHEVKGPPPYRPGFKATGIKKDRGP